MAGFNRNSRGVKRPFASPSSSTTYSYYITTAIFLILCIAGAWLLASTSVFNSQSVKETNGQIARALSLSSFMNGGEMERIEAEGNGEEEKKDEEQGELQQNEEKKDEEQGELQQNEEKKEEEQGELQQSEEKKDEEQGELQQNEEKKDEEQVELPQIEEKKENDRSNQREISETGGENNNENNHEEAEQETKNEEQEQEVKSDEQEIKTEEQETKLGEQEIKTDDDREKEKQKLKEESSLDGGMEEEQNTIPKEIIDNNESKEEIKPSENIEQVTAENQNPKETEEESKKDEMEPERTEMDKWATQSDQSHKQKETQNSETNNENNSESNNNSEEYEWRVCNESAGADYIPCLDNLKAIKKLKPENYRHYEHRERHCPEEPPTCLVPVPEGYKRPVEWPKSRDKIWYNNVPHTKLAEVKGHQNWVKVTGEYLSFPGGGTQFIHGALHYIDFLQQSVRGIAWGKRTRVILDVGCGVASLGGYMFERDVLTMSFAPKDEHEAQVQLVLERGIPAISAVMGAHRLPFPGGVFDVVHCARCRVPWHADGGQLLLELNRVLRPGGYFVWSATPVYQKLEEDVEIWKAMKSLTRSMCWDLVTIKKDRLNGVGAAFFRKPTSNECYNERKHHTPPMCDQNDDPNTAWYIRMKACMHQVPTSETERGTNWPQEWPKRLNTAPYWLNSTETAQDDFVADMQHWRNVVKESYLTASGIDWKRVRNVMDMRAVYGGFAAALKDEKVWVMNVVNVDAPDTLPVIYERGLFGIYHDWCESFSTYPRTYDLLHADHLFSKIRDRCPILPIIVEVDRIVRPGGKIIIRDDSSTIGEVETLLKSLHWNVQLTQEGVLFAEKSDWRPEILVESS